MAVRDVPTTEPETVEHPVNQRVTQRVRSLRKAQGWTLEQLATMSGVSKSMLSQIERGAANPTLVVAHRIAQAFGLALGQFVDGPAAAPPIEVVRADEPVALVRDDELCRIRRLSPLNQEPDAEFYEITLQPGRVLERESQRPDACELLTVQSGVVRVCRGEESVDLARGDSAHYAADLPHRLENTSDGPVVLYLVVQFTPSSGRR